MSDPSDTDQHIAAINADLKEIDALFVAINRKLDTMPTTRECVAFLVGFAMCGAFIVALALAGTPS